MDFPGVGTTADHAYWLSGIALRDGGGAAPLGTVDARSRGVRRRRPEAGRDADRRRLADRRQPRLDRLHEPVARPGAPRRRRAARDVLDLTARNVGAVTVHPRRARLSCDARCCASKTDGPRDGHARGLRALGDVRRAAASRRAPPRPASARASARPRGRRLRVRFARRASRPVTVDVFRNSRGRRVLGNRRVARFTKRKRSFTWKARGAGAGIYTVRLRSGGDVRRFVLARRGGRFHRRPRLRAAARLRDAARLPARPAGVRRHARARSSRCPTGSAARAPRA